MVYINSDLMVQNNTSNTTNPNNSSNTKNTNPPGGHPASGGTSPTGNYEGGGVQSTNDFHGGIPAFLDEIPQITDSLENCLGSTNTNIGSFVFNQTENATQLNTYLQNNNCSPEAQNFAIQAIEALMEEEGNFNEIPIIDTPEVPINDISEFLDCFELNQPAQITIFVDQPISNFNIVVNTHSVGHAFIGITQGSNISIFGFYPNNNSTSPWNTEAPQAFGDDSSHVFDVSLTINITPTQLNNIINYTLNFTDNYDLNDNNCTDFAIQIGNLGGLNIDECNSNWILGSGSNPAKLGQTIRNMDLPNGSSRDTNGGNAPATARITTVAFVRLHRIALQKITKSNFILSLFKKNIVFIVQM